MQVVTPDGGVCPRYSIKPGTDYLYLMSTPEAHLELYDQVDAQVAWIIQHLREHGYEAYVVGGAVRDLLLGLEPKDYDIGTSATPEEVVSVFGRKNTRIIGRRFKLVHLFVKGKCYEISTFRREPSPDERCGRPTDDGVMLWRDNQYGTVEQDAHRRDFTINALYLDLFGESPIVDYQGGLEDIEKRRVRMIGDADERLQEDPVRLLRALKLVGIYGFSLETELEQAIAKHVHLLAHASCSRLFEEFLKILLSAHSCNTFDVFQRMGLLDYFVPAMANIWQSHQGEYMRALLSARDRRMVRGLYPCKNTCGSHGMFCARGNSDGFGRG